MMLHSTRGVTAQGTGGVKEKRDKTRRCDVNRDAVIRKSSLQHMFRLGAPSTSHSNVLAQDANSETAVRAGDTGTREEQVFNVPPSMLPTSLIRRSRAKVRAGGEHTAPAEEARRGNGRRPEGDEVVMR